MITTVQLVTFMDLIPLWVVKMGDTVKFKTYEKLFITSVLIIFMIEILMVPITVNTIREFVNTLNYLAGLPASLNCILYIWLKNKEETDYLLDLKSLVRIRRTENSNSSDLLVFAGVLVQITAALMYTLQYTMSYYGLSPLSFNSAYAWAIVNNFQSQIVVLKYFNIQSFNIIIGQLTRERSNVFAMISTIRELMNNSSKTNQVYSQITAVSYSYCFMNSVTMTANLWMQFGVKKEIYQENEYGIIVGCALFHLLVISVNFICTLECSKVSDIQWKVDLAINNGQADDLCRSQLIVFLQELHHGPLEFTGMDLFAVGCSSYTIACGLIVNFTLVFIQFI